jgi:hypothetical protein
VATKKKYLRMKHILSSLLFISLLFVGLVAKPQSPDRFPKLHQRIIQAKLGEIRFKLKLDQANFEKFRPIYLRYDSEITRIDFIKLARLMKVETDSLTAEEADKLIISQLNSAKKLIDIRERYYKEFRTVLTPQQIIRLYQTEAELRKKVMDELRRRMMRR